MAFVAADYWDVTGTFASETGQFTAKIATVDGARVATGSDFADDGTLKSRAKSATVLTQRSEEHTSELQSRGHLVCRLLLEKNKAANSGAVGDESVRTQVHAP